MYDTNNINFKNLLKEYRKSRGITLEELGNRIGRTKATISKYEKGEIIPDILTVLEICNALSINIVQLFPMENTDNTSIFLNPFNTNKLYLYYFTEKILITSIIELIEENNNINVKLYNGIKNSNNYADKNAYYYEGFLETNKTNGYINLCNSTSKDTQFEKIQISFNIPWSNEFEITNFFMIGLTPNANPVIKKGIISVKEINDFEAFDEDLKITDEELKNIKKNNAWILENKNYNHFFFDKKY